VKKILLMILMVITILAIFLAVYFVIIASKSRSDSAPGLTDGQLAPCPESPNCVSSQAADGDSHAITPIRLSNEHSRLDIEQAIRSLGGTIVTSESNYLAAEVRSSLFGFVDDLELLFEPSGTLVHVRSASRVGYSDLDANRKRVEALRVVLSP